MRREWANNRLKLAHHRVLARAMKNNPDIVGEARAVLDAWTVGKFRPEYVDTWRRLLDAPVEAVRREIVRDTPHADWLRGSSPFSLIPTHPLTPDQVRRLWRMAASRAIRILRPIEYPLFAEHLKRLGEQDRLTRFWAARDDRWIDTYVSGLSESDGVIGHFDEDLVLDGAVHVGLVDRAGERTVEIGISVLPQSRHRGIAHHLLERAILWARNHRATSLHAICMTSNKGMVRLARDHDMEIFRVEGDTEGLLHMPPGNAETLSLELLENQFGEWDYWEKAHHTAYAFAMGPPPILSDDPQVSRLDKLAAMGRTDLIATYVLVMRYVLTHLGLGPDCHLASLARLRLRLEPRVGHDPHLSAFVSALPELERFERTCLDEDVALGVEAQVHGGA